ncbi:MAG: histidine phosphatase family protein [Balneolaceae bacterium]|nr:histidine phosphatase family protein [Balneolaceae bacterium]
MKQLFVVRHGETDNNKQRIIQGSGIDASINERGIRQAQAISESLQEHRIDRLICSSLKRTYETAQPLAELKELQIERYPDLNEINFGILEGEKFTEIQPAIEEIHQEWSNGNVKYAPDGGESPLRAFERAHQKVLEILESSEKESEVIVLMVYGRLIRILLSEWLGLGLENMHKVEHQNGAINRLIWYEGIFKAIELNKTDHLLELI